MSGAARGTGSARRPSPATARGALLAGRYRVLRPLGRGGMATVLLCRDERLGRRVAVKRLHATSPAEAARRFAREARLGASLNHPNLVAVFDTLTDDEGVLIVMEHVEGETLAAALRRGPLDTDAALAVLSDLASALDHAHAHGVVHRDVKPANVLLRDDGAAKLVDLGIATAADATRITRSGVVLGSAAYMAPEQVAGQAATPASDVYALALVAFEALSGRRARSGRTPLEIAERVAAGSPPDLREAWPAAPPAAADVLRRALAHDPERRPYSAGALAGLLAGALRPGPARPGGRAAASHGAAARGRAPGRAPTELRAAAPPGAVPVTRAVRRRRAPELVAAAALALTTLSVAAVVALSHGGAGERPPDRAVAKRQRPASSPDRLRALAYAPATSQATTAQPPAAPPAQTAPAPSAEPSSQAAPPATSPTPPATSPSTHSTPERAAPRAGATLGAGASLNQRGFELMGRGSYRQAVRVLRRAVDAFPAGTRQLDYAYALYNLGRSLRLSGRGKQAVPVLKRRLAIPNQTAVVRRELDAARAKHNARARAERKRAR